MFGVPPPVEYADGLSSQLQLLLNLIVLKVEFIHV